MPPVCKIMDYGKFKYEDSKKRKDAKKHQSTVTYKEIKFRPKTDVHDLQFKVDHIRRFLSEGNKARLVVIFRGREIVHPETGQAMLKKVVEATSDIAVVEQPPMMEGRRMLMIIAPRGGVVSRPPSPAGAPSASAPRPAAPQGSVPAPQQAAPRPATAPAPSAPKPAPSAAKPAQVPVSVKPP